jgi:predicted nucleic acid-binding protein
MINSTTTTTLTGLGLTGTISTNGLNTYSTTVSPDFIFSTISNYMENNTSQSQQVKVAVFEIERDEDQKVISTQFINEFWIEHKPKANLTLAVAKKLAKDVDLDKIVIKELSRTTF